jgi:hypothetical protein
MRVYKLVERRGSFNFSEHLEQVADWADSLIVDIEPGADGAGLAAYMAWNSQVPGAIDAHDPIADQPIQGTRQGDRLVCTFDLPQAARTIPILGPQARLRITVTDRQPAAKP